MPDVYYKRIDAKTTIGEIQKITVELLTTIVSQQKIPLEKRIPLKVHFGEMGNQTYLKSENFTGITDYLKAENIETCYIETNVMYGGQRHCRELHLKTAEKHGFTQLPIVIADGERGENYIEIPIHKKHYDSCKIGRDFVDYRQLIILSHFKGHAFAGFGGAIKQLAMGHASKGGKLAMHMGIKPWIIGMRCRKCKLCQQRCNEHAITIGQKKSYIDQEKCVGCGACVSICPYKAISILSPKGICNILFNGNNFREKIVEYAFAAQSGKNNIYMNFVMNVTKGCDCEPKRMKPIMDDFGIFIATDPVAIDQACYDIVKKAGKAFRGEDQLKYAEKIGCGSRHYTLLPG